jgi:2-keto-3-deoxy-L-rhamnonate aldolase RhmA
VSEAEGLDLAGESRILRRTLAFKKRLREGGVVMGAWLSLNDPVAAEIMGSSGFDYLIIDTEHGAWDLQPLQTSIMALNGTDTVPIVRVPWNDHVRIKQMLDLGVEGILAPMVRTAEECRELVAACRYPPVGRRGFGPRRASSYYRDIKAYEARANEAIFVMPQIEDIATVDRLDEFLAVPGIDAVAIGPNDMSGTAGLFRDPHHPTIRKAVDTIAAKASARGIPVCLGVNTPPAEQREWIAKGVRMLLVTSDLELLAGGSRRVLEANRDAMKG